MSRIITEITGEGFRSIVTEHDDLRVSFLGDGDIDADGANGQRGGRAAYTSRDDGSEALANGGMRLFGNPRRVVEKESWFKDIVLIDAAGNPKVESDGVIISKTAYIFPGVDLNDRNAYVDSETIVYGVVPPSIISGVAGIVKGCKMRITNRANGKIVNGITGDVGPRKKIGEISIAAARGLGINPSPRTGGTNAAILFYELWPGVHGEIDGKKIALMKASGGYINP